MNLEVRDAKGTIIATGIMTEMGPLLSPKLDAGLVRKIQQVLDDCAGDHSGMFGISHDGEDYTVLFGG